MVALLFAAEHLHADVPPAMANPPAAVSASPIVTGRISGEPLTAPSTTGVPPEPSPLAPLPPPVVEAAAVGSTGEPAVPAAALATSAQMPASPPPDVVDDRQPITGSVFDHQDYIDRHPVESARSITGSTFDREDAINEHPVP